MEKASRLLFVRVGRMKFYAGPQMDDERPRGGGKYTAKNIGHEVFNFSRDFGGTLYGTFGIVRPHTKHPRINLQRIDPATSRDSESLDSVLVIFVARYDDGQRIVGWYGDAEVYSASIPYPTAVRDRIQEHFAQEGIENSTFNEYRLEAEASNAVRLPENIRMIWPKIPAGRGGMGQSNVCYSYDANGEPKDAPWISEVSPFEYREAITARIR